MGAADEEISRAFNCEVERDELDHVINRRQHRFAKGAQRVDRAQLRRGPYQAQRMRNEDVAAVLRISVRKIDRVKRRFVEWSERRAGWATAGAEYVRKADGDFEAHLVALSCSAPPAGHSRWSLRLLADRVVELQYIDQVSRQNRRLKTNQTVAPPMLGHSAGQNADFVAAMEHVLDIYKRPMIRTIRWCAWMNWPLIRETRLPQPARPGRLVRYDFEYERCGVYNVFLASEPLAGRRWIRITGRKTQFELGGIHPQVGGSLSRRPRRSCWSWTI